MIEKLARNTVTEHRRFFLYILIHGVEMIEKKLAAGQEPAASSTRTLSCG
jgi:hypothetical protein